LDEKEEKLSSYEETLDQWWENENTILDEEYNLWEKNNTIAMEAMEQRIEKYEEEITLITTLLGLLDSYLDRLEDSDFS
jgi:hypothetical protein